MSLTHMLGSTNLMREGFFGCLRSLYKQSGELGGWLMLAMLALFPSKTLPDYPAAMIALLGLFYFLKSPGNYLRDPLVRLLAMLFACLWLPMVIALPDAINPGHAARTTWPYLRFLCMGLFVLSVARCVDLWSAVIKGTFVIVSFWCVDALLQYWAGHDVFGFPGAAGSVYGVFYPEITLGHVSAALSPLYFHALQQLRVRWMLATPLVIILALVVVLSERRAAWIMFVLSCLSYVWITRRQFVFDRRQYRRGLIIVSIGIAALAATIMTNTLLKNRIYDTLGVFSGDYTTTNHATSSRLGLWQTATNIFVDHWFNGIGPRGYRYAYAAYSDPRDIFHQNGQTHPHQLVLEVLAETGMIGFIGLVAFCVIAYRYLRRNPSITKIIWPGVLAVVVAAFPLNTHMAFYGSYWSSLIWWMILLVLAGAAHQSWLASQPLSTD